MLVIPINFSHATNDTSESAETSSGQDINKFNLIDIDGLNIDLDLKTLEQGEVGLDYELEYTYPIISTPDGIAGSDMDFKVLSKGYIASEKENSQNSIMSEVRFSGHLSFFGMKKDKYGSFIARRNKVISILSELEEIDAFKDNDKEKGTKLYKELKELLNPKSFRFITVDVHVKDETNQSFNDNQYVIGAGATTDLAIFTGTDRIAKIVDFPFSLLRSRKNTYVTQIPRIYVGYDYVTDSNIDARKELTTEDSFSRLSLQCAWMTNILENIQVRMTWQGYYEIDAPQGIKDADKDVTSLFEISAGLPLKKNESSMVFIKYTDGELPPTVESNSNISIGWRVEF